VLSLAMTWSSASCSMLRARKSMAKEMLPEHDTASAGAFSERWTGFQHVGKMKVSGRGVRSVVLAVVDTA
jgi:hypothetical protein